MLNEILDRYPEENFLTADGFDSAVIGLDTNGMRLIYSVRQCIDILVEQGMEEIDAIEHFTFNVSGAYVGEQTPIWCEDDF